MARPKQQHDVKLIGKLWLYTLLFEQFLCGFLSQFHGWIPSIMAVSNSNNCNSQRKIVCRCQLFVAIPSNVHSCYHRTKSFHFCWFRFCTKRKLPKVLGAQISSLVIIVNRKQLVDFECALGNMKCFIRVSSICWVGIGLFILISLFIFSVSGDNFALYNRDDFFHE